MANNNQILNSVISGGNMPYPKIFSLFIPSNMKE